MLRHTTAAWSKLIKNPDDRRAAARQYIEPVGGKLHGFRYALGDHDAFALWEAPDNVAMVATAIAINAGGTLSEHHTTEQAAWRAVLPQTYPSAAGGCSLWSRSGPRAAGVSVYAAGIVARQRMLRALGPRVGCP